MEKISKSSGSAFSWLASGARLGSVGAFVALVGLCLFFSVSGAHAQSSIPAPQVDYKGQPPVDSDLDGLTDAAELQIYRSDPGNADTDGDGWYDGAEVAKGSDPLRKSSFPGLNAEIKQPQPVSSETPWAWYVSRASAFVAFALLYLSIFFGLTLRIPWLQKVFSPVYSLDAHRWISLYATLFAFVHGGVLVFDKFFKLTLVDLFVPFASSYQPALMAAGILGLYLMVILVGTSYGKKYISQKLWRAVHFLNIVLYIIVLGHAYYLGTDMKNVIVSNVFLTANLILIVLMLINIELRISDVLKKRRALV